MKTPHPLALLVIFGGSVCAAGPVPVMVKDIRPGSDGSEPRNLTTGADGTLFFSADDGVHGRELWKTDGTVMGTIPARNAPPTPSGIQSLAPYADGVAVNSLDKVWRWNGTPQSTAELYRASYHNAWDLTPAGNKLFFTNRMQPVYGTELWCSTGGTSTLMTSIPLGSTFYRTGDFVVMGGNLYFYAMYNENASLWRSDGTPAGTFVVKHFPEGNIGGLCSWNGALYFSARQAATGYELWKSDGTPEGTALLRDINPGSTGSACSGFVPAGGNLFFLATHPSSGRELWKTDGTSAGTVLVKDILTPGSEWYSYQYLRGAVDRLYFFMQKNSTRNILWTSDGTAAGTRAMTEIEYYDPRELTVAGSQFYFIDAGQMWVSDGTSAGTAWVGPGDARSLTVSGRRLYFVASTLSNGELWSVPVRTTPLGSLAPRSASAGGVTFDATVDPGAQTSTALLHYGPTAAYGQTVPVTLSASNETGTVVVAVSGLPAGVTWHASLAVSNAAGAFTGPDVAFSTLSSGYAAWMQTNFGVSDTTAASAPDGDADGDSHSNYFEYVAGTGPLSPASAFSVSFIPGGLGIGPVRPGVRYVAETSGDLGIWTASPPVEFAAPAAAATLPLAGGGARKFVRVNLELVP